MLARRDMNLLVAFARFLVRLLHGFCILGSFIDLGLIACLNYRRKIMRALLQPLQLACIAAVREVTTVESLDNAKSLQPSVFVIRERCLLVLLIEQQLLTTPAITSDGSDLTIYDWHLIAPYLGSRNVRGTSSL